MTTNLLHLPMPNQITTRHNDSIPLTTTTVHLYIPTSTLATLLLNLPIT